ncbi:hypothetical protein LINGRAHAP2_LOCUS10056 [Linum grandiflorum]
MTLIVQLLEVPQHCLTTEFDKEVMAPVGEVLSADMYTTRPNGAGRPFIKVVVRMDLMASFPGKVEAIVPNAPSFDVLLGYEGLPTICFLCGLLGHIQRSCDHATLISPTPGLRGMWMLGKPSGYLLEDIDIDTPHLSNTRPTKPHRPPRLLPPPLTIRPVQSAAPSWTFPPISAPNPEVPLINELEDMLLVDRKRHHYDKDPMEDIPPKRLRSAIEQRVVSPIPEDDYGMVSFECDDLLDDVPDEGTHVGRLPTSPVEEGRREGPPPPP